MTPYNSLSIDSLHLILNVTTLILECITSLTETCPDNATCEAEHTHHALINFRIKEFNRKTKRRYYESIPQTLNGNDCMILLGMLSEELKNGCRDCGLNYEFLCQLARYYLRVIRSCFSYNRDTSLVIDFEHVTKSE